MKGDILDTGTDCGFCPPLPSGIAIYTTFLIINTMSYKAAWLPLLLERVGVREFKHAQFMQQFPI